MNCPHCGDKLVASVEFTGGCTCHHDEYCYCPSIDTSIVFYHAGGSVKGKPCTRTAVKPPSLGDQDSIARWFTKHYKAG